MFFLRASRYCRSLSSWLHRSLEDGRRGPRVRNVGREQKHYLHLATLFGVVTKKLAQKGQIPQKRNFLQGVLFFLRNQAANNQGLSRIHAYIGVCHATGNTIILELADEHRRADLCVHSGRYHFAILTQQGLIFQLDAGIQIFCGSIITAAVVLFRLDRNVVAYENAGLSTRNGNNMGLGQYLGLALLMRALRVALKRKA